MSDPKEADGQKPSSSETDEQPAPQPDEGKRKPLDYDDIELDWRKR